jgi:hypothetical protein
MAAKRRRADTTNGDTPTPELDPNEGHMLLGEHEVLGEGADDERRRFALHYVRVSRGDLDVTRDRLRPAEATIEAISQRFGGGRYVWKGWGIGADGHRGIIAQRTKAISGPSLPLEGETPTTTPGPTAPPSILSQLGGAAAPGQFSALLAGLGAIATATVPIVLSVIERGAAERRAAEDRALADRRAADERAAASAARAAELQAQHAQQTQQLLSAQSSTNAQMFAAVLPALLQRNDTPGAAPEKADALKWFELGARVAAKTTEGTGVPWGDILAAAPAVAGGLAAAAEAMISRAQAANAATAAAPAPAAQLEDEEEDPRELPPSETHHERAAHVGHA